MRACVLAGDSVVGIVLQPRPGEPEFARPYDQAGELLAGDLGCLMNMDGKMKREGRKVEVRHVAEVLAGMTEAPPIGGKA